MMTDPTVNRLAVAALLVALGATDEELDDTFDLLRTSRVPEGLAGLVADARQVLAEVRSRKAVSA